MTAYFKVYYPNNDLLYMYDKLTGRLVSVPTDNFCDINQINQREPQYIYTMATINIQYCSPPIWNRPTISPMSNTVMANPVTLPIPEFTTASQCGEINYKLECPQLFMTIDYNTLELVLAPTQPEDVGTFYCRLHAILVLND